MLTIEFAKAKVLGFIETIAQIRELDYPFKHSEDALNELDRSFREILNNLEKLGPSNSALIVTTNCQRALEALYEYLPVLGFIARSTEVSGPVEFHGPFLRLVRQALGGDPKLIISSEWDFSPFTYIFPELFHQHQFVFVGLPVSESDNALVTPLAGHELGHNIWEQEQYESDFKTKISEGVVRVIKTKYWDEFSSQFSLENQAQIEDDLFGTISWADAVAWAGAQCQELFSDFIGLMIFRESYLYAFAYLVAPWGFARYERYPSTQLRISAMISAAHSEGIEIPKDYEKLFMPTPVHGDLLLKVSDDVVESLITDLISHANNIVTKKELRPVTELIERIKKDFLYGVPASETKSITNIIIAGWELRNEGKNPWEDLYPISNGKATKWHHILNELMLKSFEVFEIEQLQKGEVCSTAQQSLPY